VNKTKTPAQRSPLKWAGGKFQVLPQLLSRLPRGRRLIEPFVGSAVVALNAPYDAYLLNDANRDLITFFRVLQSEGEEFIRFARHFFRPALNQESEYYLLRSLFNETEDEGLKAALFLYLNKHGYNGLVRYNASGKSNVPFGRYRKPYFPEKEMAVLLALADRVTFTHGDFADAMQAAEPGDVVYCDPPYIPLSSTANFTAYSAGGFGREQQERLAALAEELCARGVHVLISNHYTTLSQQLYRGATKRHRFDVKRFISCDGENRTSASEILAIYMARSGDDDGAEGTNPGRARK
jgi:DNA adenine methylase